LVSDAAVRANNFFKFIYAMPWIVNNANKLTLNPLCTTFLPSFTSRIYNIYRELYIPY
jgi:hypothetical protein